MNGRQVISFNVQRAKGYSDVTVYDDVWKELAQDREGRTRRSTSPRSTTTSNTPKKQYTSRDGGPDRRRDPRGPRGAPVPSRHPRDRHLGARDPALGDPRLLVHEPARHHAERPVAARAQPGRRRAGRRRDRRDREHRRHMRMGKSAYQASLDAADEIGLAVLATTMSIVAVFLPVALMPGISGQFFKAFGFTVVIAVLMSLARRAHDHAADRGLFPALARRAAARRRQVRWTTISALLQLVARYAQGARLPAAQSRLLGQGHVASVRPPHVRWSAPGSVRCCSRGVLFVTLADELPAAGQRRLSRRSISTLPPGSTLEQTEAVADRIARDRRHATRTSSACSSASTSASAMLDHRPEARTASRPAPSSSARSRRSSPRSPTRASASRARTAAARRRRATSCSILGGEDPVQLNAAANKIADEMATMPGPSRAAGHRRPRAARKSPSSRASTSPPTSA